MTKSIYFTVLLCLFSMNCGVIIESGPRGEKGDRGAPGPPGICICENNQDYDKPGSISKDIKNEKKLKSDADVNVYTDVDVEASKSIENEGSIVELNNKDQVKLDKGYTTNNFRKKGGLHAFDNEVEFERKSFKSDDELEVDFGVKYTESISKNFEESFGDEGHRGSYKGSEFDISSKLSDKQGRYSDKNIENAVDVSKYGNNELNSKNNVKGRYNEEIFNKYTDDDTEKKYKNKYGKYDDNGSKYDRYEDKPYKYTEKYGREYIDKENEDKYEKYGDSFNDKIKFDKSDYVNNKYGEQFKGSNKEIINQEKFRDINNKGHNRLAEYAGDYNNRKKYHNLNSDVNVDIKAEQNSTFDGGFIDGKFVAATGVDSATEETEVIRGKKVSKGFEKYNELDELNEKEHVSKYDDKKYKDRYNELNEHKNIDVSKENDIGYKSEKGQYFGGNNEYKSRKDPYLGRKNGYKQYKPKHVYNGRKLLGFNEYINDDIVGLKNDIKKLYFGIVFIGIILIAQTVYIINVNTK